MFFNILVRKTHVPRKKPKWTVKLTTLLQADISKIIAEWPTYFQRINILLNQGAADKNALH